MMFIEWQVKDDPLQRIHQSPRIFSAQRATYLVEMANREFCRAHHWTRSLNSQKGGDKGAD
jgi:hypothetical protein